MIETIEVREFTAEDDVILMSPNVVFNKIKEPHLFVYQEILASQA
jgi:hypothetical protein